MLSDGRGQYSDAVLSSLESQNDAEVEGISAKVRALKEVLTLFFWTWDISPLNILLTTVHIL